MEKNKKLVIVGAGELAMIAYEYFTYDSAYEVYGFAVERDYIESATLYELPIVPLEDVQQQFPPSEFEVFVAIPASQLNRLRTRLYQSVKEKGYICATYISSRAFVWRNAKIGENCFIFENNTVQPFVEIGNNVILWSGNHIGHRSVIEDNCFISSPLAKPSLNALALPAHTPRHSASSIFPLSRYPAKNPATIESPDPTLLTTTPAGAFLVRTFPSSVIRTAPSSPIEVRTFLAPLS